MDPILFLGILLALSLASFFRASALLFSLSSLAGFIGIHFVHWNQSGLPWELLTFDSSSFRLFFGSLVTGLGFLVGLYSKAYMNGSSDLRRLFGLIGLFQWSCLLLIFSNHAILLVIAWEITSLMSFFLIGFKTDSEKAQKGAFQALLITGSGGLCLLGAMILLGESIGSYQLSNILSQAQTLSGSPVFQASMILVALAVMTKSAQFPFHFWLPGAMAAPTPISAYLHSATLVKLGLFLAGLFWPLFRNEALWHVGLSSIGFITFAWGAFFSIFQTQLKAGLAHTTFSQLGLILVFLVQRSEESFQIGCLLLLAHALYKFVLFLNVGVFTHFQNQQDIRFLGGWKKRSPVLFLIATISCLSMAGLPPLLGFLGKEMALMRLLTAPFMAESARYFSLSMFFIGALFTITFASLFLFKVFLERPKENPDVAPIKLGFSMSFAMLVPALLSIVISLKTESLKTWLSDLAQSSMMLKLEAFPLHINSALIISLVLVGAGIALAALLIRSSSFWNQLDKASFKNFKLEQIFQKLVFERAPKICSRITYVFEELFWKFGLGVLFLCLLLSGFFWMSFNLADVFNFKTFNLVHLHFSLSLFFAGVIALILYFYYGQFLRIFLLGLIGFIVAFSFALFGAPDLVLTQILVESCSLALLVLAWINSKRPFPPETRSFGAWVISIATACFIVLIFQNIESLYQTKLAALYFFENSLQVAKGANIVNVILVDFRGLDTLGEISVLAIVYFGCASLHERYTGAKNLLAYPHTTDWMRRLGFVLAIGLTVFGLFFLIRGHNYPGGGFIGGLLFALALFLRSIFTAKKIFPVFWTLLGLSLAYVSASFSGISATFFESLKYFGPITTPFLFDTGVFFTVAGSLSGLLEILLKLRSEKWRLKSEELSK
ncbi:MAG: hydrogen gas-evolving membrane-bound hydrogenase subunit E [Bdellovibrionota bacterium]